jgi:hypothetical protein
MHAESAKLAMRDEICKSGANWLPLREPSGRFRVGQIVRVERRSRCEDGVILSTVCPQEQVLKIPEDVVEGNGLNLGTDEEQLIRGSLEIELSRIVATHVSAQQSIQQTISTSGTRELEWPESLALGATLDPACRAAVDKDPSSVRLVRGLSRASLTATIAAGRKVSARLRGAIVSGLSIEAGMVTASNKGVRIDGADVVLGVQLAPVPVPKSATIVLSVTDVDDAIKCWLVEADHERPIVNVFFGEAGTYDISSYFRTGRNRMRCRVFDDQNGRSCSFKYGIIQDNQELPSSKAAGRSSPHSEQTGSMVYSNDFTVDVR